MVIPLSPKEIAERIRMEDRDSKELLRIDYEYGETRESRVQTGKKLGYSNFQIRLHEIWGSLTGMYEPLFGRCEEEPIRFVYRDNSQN